MFETMETTFCIFLHEDKDNLIISVSIGKEQDFSKFYKKKLISGLEFKVLLIAKLLNSFAIGKNETSFHEIKESTAVLSQKQDKFVLFLRSILIILGNHKKIQVIFSLLK